jgi:VCBS repeat-containing protein
MLFSTWLRNWKRPATAARRRTPSPARQRTSFCPRLEAFEERALPSSTMIIDDVAHVESLSGQTAFVFTVSLPSGPSRKQVGVKYATVDGTATAASGDYVPTSGTLQFAPGQTSKTITVLVNAATTAEPDETFYVRISKASNAYIYKNIGVGNILTPFFTARDDRYLMSWDLGGVGNVLSNDQDQTGGGLRVSAVNGSAANVGGEIHLASGALLTVNPDGSFVYNPNNAFNWLANTPWTATDTFTYTVTDSTGAQSTATVTITIYDPYFSP